MRKIKLIFGIVVFLFMVNTLRAQEILPDEAEGEYLDQVPISGEPFFILTGLVIGGYLLVRNRKRISSRTAD